MSGVSTQERLFDILDAIAAVERYTSGGRERFNADELVRVWCMRHIEIIGEAVSKLPVDVRAAYPAVPWREIVAMRNLLIHQYRDIADREIWSVVEKDLPTLRSTVEQMLSNL